MNFLKRQKLMIKLTKPGRRNQILRQFFAEKLLVMFLTRLEKKCLKTQEFKHKLNIFELRKD